MKKAYELTGLDYYSKRITIYFDLKKEAMEAADILSIRRKRIRKVEIKDGIKTGLR